MAGIKQLIQEIHRRSLWQVLAIYLAVAWALLEAADQFSGQFGLPWWVYRGLFAALLVGLPIVLATAFFQRGLPAITRRDPTLLPDTDVVVGDPSGLLRLFTWRNAFMVGMFVFALWGAVSAGWLVVYGGTLTGSDEDQKSVAVLPFGNMSADPENEYFSDGITDDIITHLSMIADLKVISRHSSMLYKGSEKSLRQIAEELGVATILEGGVQRIGDRVRVNAQLIDAESDKHLWVQQYDRDLTDVFAIQSDVAQHIAAALRATLTRAEKEQIEEKPTQNSEAYDYYSRARFEFYKYTREGNEMAVELLEKALVHEPGFALAHAGLSLSQSQMIKRGWTDDAEWLDKAEQSARTALEIDPDLAEGYFARGFMFEGRRMYEEMEEAMRAVLAVNPNHAHAHDGLADVLVRHKGLLDDALREYEIAQRLDPFLYPAAFNMAFVLYYQGRYRESLRKLRDASEIWPGSSLLRSIAGLVLQDRGEHRAAIESYTAAIAISPEDVGALSGRAVSYLSLGDTVAYERDARRLLELSSHNQRAKAEHNYVQGFIALARGRREEAISRFGEAFSSAVRSKDWRLAALYGTVFGEAHLANGQARAAAEQFNETLRAYPFKKILHYHLGVALQAAGDTAGALAAYREFMEAWKDADEDAPLLVDAQERLVKLSQQDSQRH